MSDPRLSIVSNHTFGRVYSLTDFARTPKILTRKESLSRQLDLYADHVSGRAPLSPQQSLWLREKIDQLSKLENPGVPSLWPALSAEEIEYLERTKDATRRAANNIGIAVSGPVFGGAPAAARVLGAPDEVVEKMAVVQSGLIGGPRIQAARATRPRIFSQIPRGSDISRVVQRPRVGLFVARRRFKKVQAKFDVAQLDQKFKHADLFDVENTKKNPKTLSKYREALQKHLDDPFTEERGTYLYVKNSTVYFNPMNNRIVVLGPDMDFVTAFKLMPETRQYNKYISTGALK